MRIKVLLFVISIFCLFMIGCSDDLNIHQPGNLVLKTVDENPALPSISLNGTRLHAEAFGNPTDPMLVFLHGGPGGDYRNAQSVKQFAGNGFYVVFYDQRGSGLSRRHPKNSYTIDIMFEDISAVIDFYRTVPNQKIFLFGHSWGGILAAGYIDRYPEKIAGAIFAEPGGFTWKHLEEYSNQSRGLNLFSEPVSDVMYLDQFLTGKENDHELLDYKLNISSSFTYAPGNAEGIEGPSPTWRNGSVVLNSLGSIAARDGYDFTQNLNQYKTKVLFIYGESNTAYGREGAEKEAAFFKVSQVTGIPDTGHEMIYFKWNSVYPVVLEYLNSLK